MLKWLLIIGPLYILVLNGLGYLSKKRIKNPNDFIMGGFNVGMVLGFISFSATLFSTFTLMGMPDFFRTHGIGAWIFLAVSDAFMLYFILWFGPRLRRLAAKTDYKGIGVLLGELYKTKWATILYFICIFIFLIPYVSIQIRGISIFLNAAFENILPFWTWGLIIILIMLTYTFTGGLKAIIYSDVLKGALLMISVWIVAFRYINLSSGLSGLFNEVKRLNPELLSVPGPHGLFTPQFLIASAIAIILIPVTQPQLTTRLIVVKNLDAMKRMSVGVCFFAIFVLAPTIFIGMAGAVHYADLSTADFLARVLIKDHSELIASLILLGLVAAGISTSDSQLFAMGTEFRSMIRSNEKNAMSKTRIAMLVFALISYSFSLVSSDQLVLLARVSFTGTGLMGPLILNAVFFPDRIRKINILFTAIAVVVFIFNLAGLIPAQVGGIQVDLLLFIILFGSILIQLISKRRKTSIV
jgi:SSS family solute:Na+ symporter